MEAISYFIGYLAIGLAFCHFVDRERKWDRTDALMGVALWPLVVIALGIGWGLNKLGWER